MGLRNALLRTKYFLYDIPVVPDPPPTPVPDVSVFDYITGAANFNFDSGNPGPWQFWTLGPLVAPADGKFELGATLSAHAGPNAARLIFNLMYSLNGGASTPTGNRTCVKVGANEAGGGSLAARIDCVEGDSIELQITVEASADGAYLNTPQGDGLSSVIRFLYG